MKTLRNILGSLLVLVMLSFASLALAQEGVNANAVSGTSATESNTQGVGLSNPLRGTNGEIDDVGALFGDILSNIIIPVTLALGVLFIVFAGLRFVMATGNEGKLTKAKEQLLYTIIGVAVVLAAEIILDILLATLNEIGNVR